MNQSISEIFITELRRITKSFPEAIVVGNSLYIPLPDGRNVRLFFDTSAISSQYDVIVVSVIDKHNGVLDKNRIRLVNVIGNHNDVSPHLWHNDSSVKWYRYRPTDDEMAQIGNQIKAYVEIFK